MTDLPSDEQTSQTNKKPHTLEEIHKNVEWANQYRLELIKLVMTLSSAMLAFTVSFRPSLKQVEYPIFMWIGWVALGLSVIGGMGNMYCWERFYISYRDYDWHKNDPTTGKEERESIDSIRTNCMVIQYFGFAVGVLAIAIFAASNIESAVPPKP